MPTQDALMGLGMPAQLSEILGANPSVVNGAGTAQVGAGKILTKNAELNTTTGQTAVILPNVLMQPFFVVNPDSDTGIVFAPLLHTINGIASATGLNIAQNKAAIIWQYKPGFWAAVVMG